MYFPCSSLELMAIRCGPCVVEACPTSPPHCSAGSSHHHCLCHSAPGVSTEQLHQLQLQLLRQLNTLSSPINLPLKAHFPCFYFPSPTTAEQLAFPSDFSSVARRTTLELPLVCQPTPNFTSTSSSLDFSTLAFAFSEICLFIKPYTKAFIRAFH